MIDPGIRAVFFDAVGTLLFPAQPVGRSYAEVARRHGSVLPEEQIGERFRVAWARQERLDQLNGWRTNEDRERARWRAIVAEAIPDVPADLCFADLWIHFSRPDGWTVNPEAPEIFAELAGRGIVLGVASNFDARLIELLDGLPDLAAVRDRCVVSSLIGWRKPARPFFEALTVTAGCEPRAILHVGDHLWNDLEGATQAGLRAVLYDPDDRTSVGTRIRRLRDLLAG
jgi:putative hydrolase of the HAD superfamily